MTVPVSLNLTRTISSGLRQCGQLSSRVSLTLTGTTTCRTAPINPGSYLWFLFFDRVYQFLFRVQRKTRRREPAGSNFLEALIAYAGIRRLIRSNATE